MNAIEQHLATRRNAGLFDFSFMSLVEVDGSGAPAFLAWLQTRSITARKAGSIVYTLVLNDDASVFIDATLWRHADGRWWLLTGRRSDIATLRERADRFDVRIRDRSGEFAILAVQGPTSARMLAELVGKQLVPDLRYFRFVDTHIGATPAIVARIGYSGELGYEILVPAADASSIRKTLVRRGAAECDFDAANTLRIESGYVLFDREITGRENPIELRLERLVQLDDRDFVGKPAFVALRRTPTAQRLVGFEISDRVASSQLPPARVTSECDSPTLRRRIALGFAPSNLSVGSAVRLDDGRFAIIARLPFYDPPRKLPRSV